MDNDEKDIEQIKQEKILKRLEKLEKENKELKTEINNLKTNKDIKKERRDKEQGMNRREFMKKAGAGALGLGAMSLLPSSALEVRDSKGLQVYDGTDTGTQALDVNVDGAVEVKNHDFKINQALIDPSGTSHTGELADLSEVVKTSAVASPNGVASLDGSGEIPNDQIPPLAINDTYSVTQESDLTTLSQAEIGDVGIVTDPDPDVTYILTGDYSVQDNWQQIAVENAPVSRVNGQVGEVSLSSSDVGAADSSHDNSAHTTNYLSENDDATIKDITALSSGDLSNATRDSDQININGGNTATLVSPNGGDIIYGRLVPQNEPPDQIITVNWSDGNSEQIPSELNISPRIIHLPRMKNVDSITCSVDGSIGGDRNMQWIVFYT